MNRINFVQMIADYIEMLPIENMSPLHLASNIVEKCEDLGMHYVSEKCDCPKVAAWDEE